MPIVSIPRWMVNRFSQEEITAAKLRSLERIKLNWARMNLLRIVEISSAKRCRSHTSRA
jgi:DNA replicative helicase MCM subunit Mcm2 (Cdc46/Mcm family)